MRILKMKIIRMIKVKKIFGIIWSMRKWSFKYVNWRLSTAYPEGWRYAIKHPIEAIKDICNYIVWCQKIDRQIKK